MKFIKTSYEKEQLDIMFKESLHDKEINKLMFFSKNNYTDIEKFKHKKQYIPELCKLIFENL